MYRIWVRDSFRSKWRVLHTKDFQEEWEANYFADRNLSLGKEAEVVALPDGEFPWLIKIKHVEG